MKKFENAEIELISFDVKDIITTSGSFDGEDDSLENN